MTTVDALADQLLEHTCDSCRGAPGKIVRVLRRAGCITDGEASAFKHGEEIFVPFSAVLFALGRLRPRVEAWRNVVTQLGRALVPTMLATIPYMTAFGIKRRDLADQIGCGLHHAAHTATSAAGGYRDRYLQGHMILSTILSSGKTGDFVSSGRDSLVSCLFTRAQLQVDIALRRSSATVAARD